MRQRTTNLFICLLYLTSTIGVPANLWGAVPGCQCASTDGASCGCCCGSSQSQKQCCRTKSTKDESTTDRSASCCSQKRGHSSKDPKPSTDCVVAGCSCGHSTLSFCFVNTDPRLAPSRTGFCYSPGRTRCPLFSDLPSEALPPLPETPPPETSIC